MDGASYRRRTIIVLMLALAVRLAAGVWWQSRLPDDRPFAFPDSESYWALGRSLAHGEPFQYPNADGRIFRTRGYPLLLAPLFLLSDEPSPLAGRVLSALLGTCAVGITMSLARRLFNHRAAILAGIAIALDPGSITTGVFVLSEAPFCPLLMLHLLAWFAAEEATSRQRTRRWAFVGITAGIATLVRPSFLLFIPFAIVVKQIISFRGGVRLSTTRWADVAAITLGLALTMSPWWIRNATITGRFVPTTLQVGASLYDGLSPQADGSSEMSFVREFAALQALEDREATTQPTNMFEERLDRKLADAATQWAWNHPGDALRLALVKFVRIWNPWPNARDLGGTWSRTAVALGYAPILLSAVWGAWKLLPRRESLILLILPAIYFTLLHMIFVGAIRYRLPAMLPLAVLGAGAFATPSLGFAPRRSAKA